MTENEITSAIIASAIQVHKHIGPGLLESAYEYCLISELRSKNLKVLQQVPLPLIYKDKKLDAGYRLDILVEDKIIVEVKSMESIADIHLAQLLTYLRLKNLRIGLLINFNNVGLKNGIKRVINGYD